MFRKLLILFFIFSVAACSGRLPEECTGVNGVASSIDKKNSIVDGVFVKNAYQVFYQRLPDNAGLVHHCDLLRDGKIDRVGLVAAFQAAPEFLNLRDVK